MATHSSVLAWRIPGTGEPGGLPSMGSHRVRQNWSNLAVAANNREETCPALEQKIGLKIYWAWPPPIRTRPRFPLSQSLSWGSFHKPLVLHQRADRLKTSNTSDIHNWVLFLHWLHLFILSGVSSPLISGSTCWPGEFMFQCPIFLPFHTVHGFLKAIILKWFAIPFSSGPCWVRALLLDLPCWVALHCMAHSFIELDKGVVHVIRLVTFVWLWVSFSLPSDGEG